MKHQAIARIAERQNLESIVETESIAKAKERKSKYKGRSCRRA